MGFPGLQNQFHVISLGFNLACQSPLPPITFSRTYKLKMGFRVWRLRAGR